MTQRNSTAICQDGLAQTDIAPEFNSTLPAWTEFVTTPAFVFDERPMLETVSLMKSLRMEDGIRVFYAVKALTNVDVIHRLTPLLDGFTVASLFDATLVRELAGPSATLSIGTPGYSEREIDEIGDLCNRVVLNSLGQWERFRARLRGRTSIGLRINPGLSNVKDVRYDPSRQHSKLGVHITALERALTSTPELLEGLDGILFHTNCDSEEFGPILEAVELLASRLGPLLSRIRWINLGGGYLYTDRSDLTPLRKAAQFLRARYGLEVCIEPGAAFVRSGGYLVARIIDIIPSSGPAIAVLDTSINHAPEVFEYQFQPEVLGTSLAGANSYLLAGSTCLAGDLFGEYSFSQELEIGDRIVFPNMGAYTTVKAHMFNGCNVPSVYYVAEDGGICLRRTFDYQDYRSRLRLGGH